MPKHDTTPRQPRVTTPPRPLIQRARLANDDFTVRCAELARLRGKSWRDARPITLRQSDGGEPVRLLFRVLSATRPEVDYLAIFYHDPTASQDDRAYCECPAGQNEQPCWHAGVARDHARRIIAGANGRGDRAAEHWSDMMGGRL